jgi:hypothetical protein
MSVLGSYDNLSDVASRGLGNLGADLRVRLEFLPPSLPGGWPPSPRTGAPRAASFC